MAEDDNRDGSSPDSDPVTIETAYKERPPSVTAVTAVAAVENIPPADLEVSLREWVDPDALDALFADEYVGDDSDTDVRAEFTVNEYVVEVRNDGTLTVTAPDPPE